MENMKKPNNTFNGSLNLFCSKVNAVVRDKGFWHSMHQSQTIIDEVLHWDIKDAVKEAFITQKIALIMSECGEAIEAMRKQNYGLEKKDSFEDELADVFIRLSDLCGELNIDIEKQIEWKLEQ